MSLISGAARQGLIRAAWRRAKAKADAEYAHAPLREYELRGNNLAVHEMMDPEILLVGAAGTGKTLAILKKMDRLMRQYPGARALIVRKVRADLAQSVLVTYERDILGFDNPICAGVQREHRQAYHYPNGSEVVVGGMDRPGRILSSEYDFIYPAEAVQFTEEDWETFVMRNRNGVIPFQQVAGDTNPDAPHHWLKQRCDRGQTRLLDTFHEDNPALWDGANWTPRGRDYVLSKLQRLTGIRRARYLDGKWVIAEGAVYEDWNEALHVIDRFEIPHGWRRFRAVDFGYNNPFVCQWWALSPDDELYLYREIYRTGRLVQDHADDILRMSAGIERSAWAESMAQAKREAVRAGERIETTVCDHDAEDRATLERYGIPTVRALKDISRGIQAVQARLRKDERGRARLYVFRDALQERDAVLDEAKKPVCTRDEFPGYVWAKTPDGKPNKETPLDLDNHGMDAARYAVMYVDGQPKGRGRKNPFY